MKQHVRCLNFVKLIQCCKRWLCFALWKDCWKPCVFDNHYHAFKVKLHPDKVIKVLDDLFYFKPFDVQMKYEVWYDRYRLIYFFHIAILCRPRVSVLAVSLGWSKLICWFYFYFYFLCVCVCVNVYMHLSICLSDRCFCSVKSEVKCSSVKLDFIQ